MKEPSKCLVACSPRIIVLIEIIFLKIHQTTKENCECTTENLVALNYFDIESNHKTSTTNSQILDADNSSGMGQPQEPLMASHFRDLSEPVLSTESSEICGSIECQSLGDKANQVENSFFSQTRCKCLSQSDLIPKELFSDSKVFLQTDKKSLLLEVKPSETMPSNHPLMDENSPLEEFYDAQDILPPVQSEFENFPEILTAGGDASKLLKSVDNCETETCVSEHNVEEVFQDAIDNSLPFNQNCSSTFDGSPEDSKGLENYYTEREKEQFSSPNQDNTSGSSACVNKEMISDYQELYRDSASGDADIVSNTDVMSVELKTAFIGTSELGVSVNNAKKPPMSPFQPKNSGNYSQKRFHHVNEFTPLKNRSESRLKEETRMIISMLENDKDCKVPRPNLGLQDRLKSLLQHSSGKKMNYVKGPRFCNTLVKNIVRCTDEKLEARRDSFQEFINLRKGISNGKSDQDIAPSLLCQKKKYKKEKSLDAEVNCSMPVNSVENTNIQKGNEHHHTLELYDKQVTDIALGVCKDSLHVDKTDSLWQHIGTESRSDAILTSPSVLRDDDGYMNTSAKNSVSQDSDECQTSINHSENICDQIGDHQKEQDVLKEKEKFLHLDEHINTDLESDQCFKINEILNVRIKAEENSGSIQHLREIKDHLNYIDSQQSIVENIHNQNFKSDVAEEKKDVSYENIAYSEKVKEEWSSNSLNPVFNHDFNNTSGLLSHCECFDQTDWTSHTSESCFPKSSTGCGEDKVVSKNGSCCQTSSRIDSNSSNFQLECILASRENCLEELDNPNYFQCQQSPLTHIPNGNKPVTNKPAGELHEGLESHKEATTHKENGFDDSGFNNLQSLKDHSSLLDHGEKIISKSMELTNHGGVKTDTSMDGLNRDVLHNSSLEEKKNKYRIPFEPIAARQSLTSSDLQKHIASLNKVSKGLVTKQTDRVNDSAKNKLNYLPSKKSEMNKTISNSTEKEKDCEIQLDSHLDHENFENTINFNLKENCSKISVGSVKDEKHLEISMKSQDNHNENEVDYAVKQMDTAKSEAVENYYEDNFSINGKDFDKETTINLKGNYTETDLLMPFGHDYGSEVIKTGAIFQVAETTAGQREIEIGNTHLSQENGIAVLVNNEKVGRAPGVKRKLVMESLRENQEKYCSAKKDDTSDKNFPLDTQKENLSLENGKLTNIQIEPDITQLKTDNLVARHCGAHFRYRQTNVSNKRIFKKPSSNEESQLKPIAKNEEGSECSDLVNPTQNFETTADSSDCVSSVKEDQIDHQEKMALQILVKQLENGQTRGRYGSVDNRRLYQPKSRRSTIIKRRYSCTLGGKASRRSSQFFMGTGINKVSSNNNFNQGMLKKCLELAINKCESMGWETKDEDSKEMTLTISESLSHEELNNELVRSVKRHNTQRVRELLKLGADPNSNCGRTPVLLRAVKDGILYIVQALIAAGAETDARFASGDGVIHVAARGGHSEIIIELVHSGAHIDAINRNGVTPLQMALAHGHLEVAQILLRLHADILAPNKVGETALEIANHLGYVGLTGKPRELRRDSAPGTRVEVPPTDVPVAVRMIQGIEEGCAATVEQCLTLGAGPNTIVPLALHWPAKASVLHRASHHGDDLIAKLLLRAGADVNITDVVGNTPLHAAAQAGHTKVVKVLLANGAKLESTSQLGMTPLHRAASKGKDLACNFLLKRGANSKAEDVSGCTPADWARRRGFKNLARKLFYRRKSSSDLTIEAKHKQQLRHLNKLHQAALKAAHRQESMETEE